MFCIQDLQGSSLTDNYKLPLYSIFLLRKGARFTVDFTEYTAPEYSILFLTPYQHLQWLGEKVDRLRLLQFHGDFYCIEYHKKEVACNGLLFNNIYLQPHINLSAAEFQELEEILEKMDKEYPFRKQFSEAVLRSYLQLFLAICSREKSVQLENQLAHQPLEPQVLDFQQLLELHFLSERSPSFYAEKLALSPSAFSRKVKQQFGKTPGKIIQERVNLEARKLLHLTRRSIKEIAADLHFDDEYYFSRYFKKELGMSPTHYREQVGISVVAN